MSRKIKNLKTFKECVRKTELIDPYTGRRKKVFQLYYGFNHSSLYIEEANVKRAYKKYITVCGYFDSYIPDDSFLNKK